MNTSPPRKKRTLRVAIIMFGGFFAAVSLLSYFSGVPIFAELREKARRTAERVIPMEKLAVRAKRSLDVKLAAQNLSIGSSMFVRIFKQEAILEVWLEDQGRYRLLHTYPICKFSGFLGPKLKEGDKQAPEGFYAVTAKQLNPGSRHYRAFNLGFPNEFDRAHGRTGSALMVHGGCTSVGCYAMTDAAIAEIYRTIDAALRNGQKRVPVHVFPFRMTQANLNSAPQGKWMPFWQTLKKGYDLFEKTGMPPKTGICGKKYVFGKDVDQCRLIAGWS